MAEFPLPCRLCGLAIISYDYSVDCAWRSVTSLHYPSFSLSHRLLVYRLPWSPSTLSHRSALTVCNLLWSLIVGADGVIHFSLIKCHLLGSSSERSLSRSCIQSIFLSFKDSYVESPTVTVYQLLALYSVHSSAAVLQCCIEFSGLIHTRMSP